MSINTAKRDIRHEMTDVIALLGDEYATTNVECNLGDTEIHLYDGPDSLITYRVFHAGSLGDSTPEDIADYIISSL